MEQLTALEEKVDALLRKQADLKEENRRLKEEAAQLEERYRRLEGELDSERGIREQVDKRIDNLLTRLKEEVAET